MTNENDTHTLRKTTPKKTLRKLKVKEGMHASQSDTPYIKRTKVGEILLKGHWVIEAGFAVNSTARVEISNNRIVLTPE